MADYHCKIRSNYFKVKPEFASKEKLGALMALFSLRCIESGRKFGFMSDDNNSFAIIESIYGMQQMIKMIPAYASRLDPELADLEQYDEVCGTLDDEIVIFDIFEFFVEPGETVVVMEIGWQGDIRSLSAYCGAYDSTGERIVGMDPMDWVMEELFEKGIETNKPED